MSAKAGSLIVRLNQLTSLGLIWNGSEYCKDDINVHWTEISTLDGNEWDELIESLTTEIDRRNNTST